MRVRDVGEQGLLERLQRFCAPEVVGDDGAVMVINPAQSLVVTTDLLVDGVHFSDGGASVRTASPQDIGWRAAAANLSDLAAMGAFPLGITVGLSLPGDVPVIWVEQLYQGMTECLQQYATPIVGGDITRSPVITVAITAFGQVVPSRIIRRGNAVVGDAIAVTGVHGASRAGLELLLHPQLGQHLSDGDARTLILAHQRPKPRLDVLPILWEVADSPRQFSTGFQNEREEAARIAGMDSSDGLADAVLQICRSSGVGAILSRDRLPIPEVLHSLSPKAIEYALYGGEDFELVLCLPPEPAHNLVQILGGGAAIVGTITTDLAVKLIDQTGKNPDEVLTLSRGFQHFS